MRRTSTWVAAGVVGITLSATPSVAQAHLQDGPIATVAMKMFNGSGCFQDKGGSPAMKVDGNTVSFTLRSGDMMAGVGANVGPDEFRKYCQLALNVHVPEGYTYGVKKATLTGSAYLETGSRGVMQFSAYTQGQSDSLHAAHEFAGLHTGKFSFTTDVASEKMVWAPCGTQRLLNVNTTARVVGGTQSADAYSWIRQDEANGLEVELATKKC